MIKGTAIRSGPKAFSGMFLLYRTLLWNTILGNIPDFGMGLQSISSGKLGDRPEATL